jgi:hypothetical protein
MLDRRNGTRERATDRLRRGVALDGWYMWMETGRRMFQSVA